MPLGPGSRPPCCWQSQLRLAPWLPSRRRRLRCPGAYYPGRILLAEQQVLSALSKCLSTATSATSCRTRTPKINHWGGRDHWGSCLFALLAGGGAAGGAVVGSSDAHA